jgi:CBS-domain-containing membrane protein
MTATVKDVMTARVVAVLEDATFKEMAAQLRASRISALPVVDQLGRVIGVVSAADLLPREAGDDGHPGLLDGLLHRREHEKAGGVTAAELMTSPAVTIGMDEPVTAAARLMRDRRVKRLPVVNDSRHLVGIVSRVDVLAVFARPDADIREEVTGAVILGQFLTDPDRLDVSVKDGIVTIAGCPETDDIGHDIVSAVRHVEGVVAVRDRMDYPGEPESPRPRVWTRD